MGSGAGAIENEVKLEVSGLQAVRGALAAAGLSVVHQTHLERDEYFDDDDGTLADADFVIRLRTIDGVRTEVGFKGPREFSDDGSHARIELEVPCAPYEVVFEAIRSKGFSMNWYFEKRRETWLDESSGGFVMLDEIPEIGEFVEIEGPPGFIASVRTVIDHAVVRMETRNYAELAIAFYVAQGLEAPRGLEFTT